MWLAMVRGVAVEVEQKMAIDKALVRQTPWYEAEL